MLSLCRVSDFPKLSASDSGLHRAGSTAERPASKSPSPLLVTARSRDAEYATSIVGDNLVRLLRNDATARLPTQNIVFVTLTIPVKT